MTTLNIRIEEKIKVKANKTLSSLGLDMSTAVKIFLNQVIIEDGLPFTPTNNKLMLKERWDKQTAHALKYGKNYKNGKDVLSDIV
ncbi:MAG: type II toxin-antitoxin system RelB/DinJ family antitoxin [Candidatus Yonathbacteria bacterium]|nr:type II toxin-antitoxin system RelB/DinJ family antitoxin [Candidatus Yonathbacteria bacterium]NTW47359.1 type II toxin-antitoxin system RelB/DinJ family antitoxin [Candidatus Yonathbacteria bacterium]